MQQESTPDLDTRNVNKDVHTSFAYIELGGVSDARKYTERALSLLRLKGRMLKSKPTQVQKLP